MASDIRISELNEINVNSDINEIIINSRESTNDTGISKKIQVANLLTDGIVKTSNIDDRSVTTGKIADKSISAIKIADKTITNEQIVDNTICNGLLADNSVDNRVMDNDDSYVAGGYTATRSILSPKVEVSNRLTVTSGCVDLNQITYTFPSTEAPRRFLRTDGSGNLTWEEAVPGDGTALVFSDTSPVGTIIPYAGGQSSVPDDKWINLFSERRFLGSAYPELRDLLGTQWGSRTNSAGDPSPTGAYYALPDLRARTMVGAGQGNDGTDTCTTNYATCGGAYKHTLTVGEMPIHRHGFTGANGNASDQDPSPFDLVKDDPEQTHNPGSSYNTGSTGILDSGGDLPHNNTQPYVAMSYIIKAKPDDIQQYDMSVGPGLSASNELNIQSPTITLSSTEIGLKVSDDFTFDGSNRLKLTGTQVNATVEHDPITDTTYLRNCTLTRTDIGRFTITVDDLGTRPTAVGSLANNWTLISSRNSAFEGQYAISVRTDNDNTSIFVEIVELDAVKATGAGNDANTVSKYSRSYADIPFQVVIVN